MGFLVLRQLLKKSVGHCIFLIIFYQEVVHAQEAATDTRRVINPLAVGGMVQGLLDMQIRPQGGFYEDRYKEIFPDDANIPLATANNFDRRHAVSNLRTRDIVSEDGRLLARSAAGASPNPCFDVNRIARNRLLLLVCSLQLSKVELPGNEIEALPNLN